MTSAQQQLDAAGYLRFLTDLCEDGACVRAVADLWIVPILRADPRFKEGIGHLLHVDVGSHRLDFRGHRGAFGSGSLQIVLDRKTGVFYADVDQFSPYEDVVGFVAHNSKVVWHRVKGWFT